MADSSGKLVTLSTTTGTYVAHNPCRMPGPYGVPLARPELPHFWEHGGLAASEVRVLAGAPNTYHGMDSVIATWDGILDSNFPRYTTHRGGEFYSIPLRRHAGAWGDGWGRSIVVQLVTNDYDLIDLNSAAGLRPPLPRWTDVAWLELAAPNKAKSRSGWRDLMRVAVDRLAEENPERRLLLILVAGFRWMPFIWDPVEPLHTERGPLVMKGDGEDERWPVDPRVYTAYREGEAEPSGLMFDPLEAYTLDYWIEDEAGTVVNLRNLAWLEKLLATARLRAVGAKSESTTAGTDLSRNNRSLEQKGSVRYPA